MMGVLFPCVLLLVYFYTAPALSPEEPPGSGLTVVGVAGDKVSLPCDVSPDTPDDEVVLVMWFKDDSVAPIYSLDARRRAVSQARHAVSDQLATRAYLTLGPRPALLEIAGLELSDDGHYRCRVDFRKAQTRNADIHLKVIVPPKKPSITDYSGEQLQSLIGPYNEGDQLLLVCEVEGGKPKPSVTWWRENVLLDATFETTSRGTVRNELTLPGLHRHDLMAMLTCQASNSNLSAPATAAVTVDMNFKPQAVAVAERGKPLSARRPVELTCRSQGSRPPAVLSWWKAGTRLTNTRDRISVDGYETTSILTLEPTVEDSGSYLACRAENPLVPGSSLEDGWNLEVHFVPQLSLRLGSKLRHSHIQEGNDVYLECNIRANPWVTEIGWRFEGAPLHTNVTAGIIVTNQSLVLQRVTRFHRSRYTCWAANAEGRGESNPVHLRVQYAPVCVPLQRTLYGAAIDETIRVSCEVDADPTEPIRFRWAFNSSLDPGSVQDLPSEAPEQTPTDGGPPRSEMSYTPSSQYDFGSLLCWARNSVDEQREPCVFNIFPAGPPEAVYNCSLHNVTESAARLECEPGNDGGLRAHYVVEVWDDARRALRAQLTAQDAPSFLLEGLPAGLAFVAVVVAVNAKGQSDPRVLRSATLAAPPPAPSRRDRSWEQATIPVLVVVVVIVVLVNLTIVLVILVVKARRRRRRRRPANLENNLERRKDYRVLFPKVDECIRDSGGEEKCPDVIPDTIKSPQNLLEEPAVKLCDALRESLDQQSPLESFPGRSLKAGCLEEDDLGYLTTSRQTVV